MVSFAVTPVCLCVSLCVCDMCLVMFFSFHFHCICALIPYLHLSVIFFRFMQKLLILFPNFYKNAPYCSQTSISVCICVCVCAHECVIMFIPHCISDLLPDLHLCVRIFRFMLELLILFASFYKTAFYCSHTSVCVYK